LQQILERNAAAQSRPINPYAVEQVRESEASFTSNYKIVADAAARTRQASTK